MRNMQENKIVVELQQEEADSLQIINTNCFKRNITMKNKLWVFYFNGNGGAFIGFKATYLPC